MNIVECVKIWEGKKWDEKMERKQKRSVSVKNELACGTEKKGQIDEYRDRDSRGTNKGKTETPEPTRKLPLQEQSQVIFFT